MELKKMEFEIGITSLFDGFLIAFISTAETHTTLIKKNEATVHSSTI
jgi:hypothetical protein